METSELNPTTAKQRRNIKVLEELTKRVSIRKTHPNMYRVLMVIALMCLALAINLYLTKPTFAPYGLHKGVIATVFLAIGICQVTLLNIYHNLKLVRITIAFSATFMMFWGLSNTQQSFAGKASFQLPIIYLALGIMQLFLLLEPASNPMTSNGNGVKK